MTNVDLKPSLTVYECQVKQKDVYLYLLCFRSVRVLPG